MQLITVTTVLSALATFTTLVSAAPAPGAVLSVSSRTDVMEVDRRQYKGDLICCPVPGQPFQPVSLSDVDAAINLVDSFTPDGLSHGCTTVASAGNAAIVVCIDRSYWTVDHPAIKEYASGIMWSCGLAGRNDACGQQFDNLGWNVIVTTKSSDPAP